MKALAVIPARGGSKGVVDKNIRLLDGKELVSYAVECALSSGKVTRTIVSTDSQRIASVAAKYKADVMIRPNELATDTVSVVSAIDHVLLELEKVGLAFDLIVLLQPTSPIRTSEDVDNVISMFEADDTLEGVISVVDVSEVHPARMYTLDKGNWMKSLEVELETTRRQSLPPVYYRNGCIYAVRTEVFKRTRSVMASKKKAYIMPYSWLLNIDHERDFVVGESLMKLWKAGNL